MPTNREIQKALIHAAGQLLGRELTEDEARRLIDNFNHETGSRPERGRRAIARALGFTPRELREKRASDDNADRIITDIENILSD